MRSNRKSANTRSTLCLSPVTGLLVIFAFTIVLIWVHLVVQSTNRNDSELSSLFQQKPTSSFKSDDTHGPPSKLRAKTMATVTMTPMVRVGTDITCDQANEKVINKEWVDPNEGKRWARQTITYPQFYISVHAQEYDPVRWRIMEEGKYYEDKVADHFLQILDNTPPSTVLDVGANIGYYTLLSASLGHSVISVEPNPSNILRLCDSLLLNGFTRNGQPGVYIFQNAVADVHGKEMMLHSPRNPGQAFLKPLVEGEKTDSHKAKTTIVTLDKVAEEQGWFERSDFKIKLLKIDVEGKEPLVIMGSSKLLKSGLVENILMEGRRFGRTNIQDSFEILFKHGYSIKEPPIVMMTGQTAREKAMAVCKWYLEKLGNNSMKVEDMWWIREG